MVLARAAYRDFHSLGPRETLLKAIGKVRRGLQSKRYDYNLRRITRSVERIAIDRPIFVLGVQGGGNTVFARCFYRHSKVVYATGNWRWWAGHDEIHNCSHTSRDLPPDMVHRSLHFGNVDAAMEDHEVFGLQRAWLYASDELLPDQRRSASDVDEESRRRFRRVIQKISLAYADDPDDCRFVDMSQLFTIQVPYVARMLEGCDPHFVVASRNPYVTCARAVEKEYGPERGGYFGDDVELRMRCAVEHWANSYRLALACRDEVPMLTVRYEDFLANPAAIIRQVDEFAGLPFEERQVPGPGQAMPLGSIDHQKWYPILPADNDRYLDQISPTLVRMLNERAADVIEELGYEIMPVRD